MKNSKAGVLVAPLLLGLLSTLAGCGAVVPDEGSGLEWARATESQSALLAILYEGSSGSSASEQAAQQSAALVQMKVGACVAATVTGPRVKYTFSDCTDLPYGLARASGVVTATYDVSAVDHGFFTSMTASGSGVSLDGATFELKATVDDSASDPNSLLPPAQVAGPGARNLTVSTKSTGTSKEGHRFTFDDIQYTLPGVLSVYADSGHCADFATTSPSLERSTGTIESQGVTWVAETAGYRHCGKGCPEAGGFVLLNNDDDGSQGNNTPRLLRFDGSATAKLFSRWVEEEEKDKIESVPFDLGCTPASK